MLVNIYIFSQAKNAQMAPPGNLAAGFVLEAVTGSGKVATKNKTFLLSDLADQTNKNHAALLIMIKALEEIVRPAEIAVYTDNSYLAGQFRNNLARWKKNSWKDTRGHPIKHKGEWQTINRLTNPHTIIWHVGEKHNYYNWLQSEVTAKRAFLVRKFDNENFAPL